MKEKIIKKIPNILTTSRIIESIMAPIMYVSNQVLLSIALYIAGIISDFLDGYIARKYNATSQLGRKLDAIADKIFALSVISLGIILGNKLMLIPLGLESVITAVNINAKLNNIEPHTIRVGKYKTACLFPTILTGLLMNQIPFLINIFIPFLILTTRLQMQSINAYINEYNKKENEVNNFIQNQEQEKNEENNKAKIKEEKLTSKENLIKLKEEFLYYTLYDINIEKAKKKVKSL